MVYRFFDKKSVGCGVARVPNKSNVKSSTTCKMNFINQLLENLKEEEFIHHLKTIII